MKKSSLLDILRTFSKEEIDSFYEFLLSPYHNKKNMVVKLYSCIKKYAPGFKDEALEKERVWNKLYPGKSFNYGVFKNLVFDLTKLAENFVAYTFFKSSDDFDECMIYGLRGRQLPNAMLKKIKAREQRLNSYKSKDETYLFHMYKLLQIRMEYNLHTLLHDDTKELCRAYILNYFLLLYFAHSINLVIEYNRKGIEYDNSLLNLFIDYIEKNNDIFLKEVPIVKIYFYLLVSLLNKSDEKLFARAYESFNVHRSELSNELKRNCRAVLNGVCGGNHKNMINPFFSRIRVQMHKDEIEDGSLVDEKTGKITINRFRNIIVTFTNSSEVENLKNFIKKYKNKVVSGDSKHLEKYAEGMCYFAEKKYKECIEKFSSIELNKFLSTVEDNLHFKVDIKMHSFYCYYILEEYESFFYSIDSFNHYIKNVKQTQDYISKYLKLLKFFRNLAEYKIAKNTEAVTFLKHEIINSDYFPWKTVLLNTVEEILTAS